MAHVISSLASSVTIHGNTDGLHKKAAICCLFRTVWATTRFRATDLGARSHLLSHSKVPDERIGVVRHAKGTFVMRVRQKTRLLLRDRGANDCPRNLDSKAHPSIVRKAQPFRISFCRSLCLDHCLSCPLQLFHNMAGT